MLFLITIKCNKVVCIERTSKINSETSEYNHQILNKVTRVFQTHNSQRETSFNHKIDVRKNHQTSSDINTTIERNALPPAFLLPDNGSASNRSVSQVPLFLLSKTNENTEDQVSSDLDVEFSNEFQLNHNNNETRTRRDINRQNLCGNECKCRQENNFDTVDCDFLQEKVSFKEFFLCFLFNFNR